MILAGFRPIPSICRRISKTGLGMAGSCEERRVNEACVARRYGRQIKAAVNQGQAAGHFFRGAGEQEVCTLSLPRQGAPAEGRGGFIVKQALHRADPVIVSCLPVTAALQNGQAEKPVGLIAQIFDGAARGLRDSLFPAICLGCHEITARQGTLCPKCWTKVRFIERPYCDVLGTPFAIDHGDGAISGDALADPPPFRRLRSAVAYGDVARKLVQSLKYQDRTDLAPWMAVWMARAGSELLAQTDVIAPVPLHPLRYLSRRFNQSAELARALSRTSGRTFDPAILIRTKRTRQQVGLGANERQDNVRGAFSVAEDQKIKVAGKSVLLVDDVYTTGATVKAAAKTLKKAGAAHVDVLTFARVVPGDYALEDVATI